MTSDLLPCRQGTVAISAAKGEGMENLLSLIESTLNRGLYHCVFLLPYAEGGRVEQLHQFGQVLRCDYTAEGIEIEAICREELFGRLRHWVKEVL